MKMVTVVAREAFPYDGVNRRAGDAFEATAEDARILVLVGRAKQPDPPSRANVTEPEDEAKDIPATPRRSRRKDIVPEA